jgi:hypothetical protein
MSKSPYKKKRQDIKRWWQTHLEFLKPDNFMARLAREEPIVTRWLDSYFGYDKDDKPETIFAKDIREWGLDLPSKIPNQAYVEKDAIIFHMGDVKILNDNTLDYTIEIEFTKPFKWKDEILYINDDE